MAQGKGEFRLTVPLDASGIEGVDTEQGIKVALVGGDGVLQSKRLHLDEDATGSAVFDFKDNPGPLRVIVGPGDADDHEIVGLQTLTTDIRAVDWERLQHLKLRPIVIPPFYWYWWLRWCRTFTIRGRVLCRDGSPVPGAKVCAYDYDSWLFWSSTQLAGCDTTDATGAFQIRFRWCCGWWPWWWWRWRLWRIDPKLVSRIEPFLQRDPDIELLAPKSQPDLSVFQRVLDDEGLDLSVPLANDLSLIDRIREPLLARLPAAQELEALHIWPWWPWAPWWDCNPDILFKVTQDCFGANKVIVDEGPGNVRWNTPTSLDVTLVANDDACCLPIGCQDPPCPDGECVVVDQVCASQVDQIGGNQAPALAPAGYLYPGPITHPFNRHRPFAGTIPVHRIGSMVGVDYYEILDELGHPLPVGAEVDFCRTFWDTASLSWGSASFPFVARPGLPPGSRAVESREHHEAASGLTWDSLGADRYWSINRNLLVPLDTRVFPDGTYRFKVRAWSEVGGTLTNPRLLPVCGTRTDAELVLTFDNRVPPPEPGHPVSHNCGLGVHTCTSEPDCHILQVRVNGHPVGICETVDARAGTLEIDFNVADPDGHLAYYSLRATYGLNNAVNLLAPATGGVLTPLAAGVQEGPNYQAAVLQGAIPPHWHGGNIRLTVPLQNAFPVPCCYQLELRVFKRTVVGTGPASNCGFSCDYGYPYRNLTEFTIGVGVCPPGPGFEAPALEPGTTVNPPPIRLAER